MVVEGDHDNCLEHELTVCKDENRSLKRRIDELTACAEKLTVERDSYLGQVNSLKEEIRGAKALCDEANEEKATLQRDIERVRIWDVQKDHEIQLLKDQLQQQMKKLQKLGKEILENQQRLHDYQYSVVPKLESEKSRLEKQKEAIDAHNKWLTKEFESQKFAIDVERKERSAYICELETKVDMHLQEISMTHSTLRRLEEERNKFDDDNDKLRKKVVDLQVASSNQDVIATRDWFL
jgi:chromosome segregation ATPase